MKVIKEDAVYVQKKDIGFLIENNMDIPVAIMAPLLEHFPFIINNDNKFDFVKYDDPTSMDFFKGFDWILDYDEVKDLGRNALFEKMEEMVGIIDSMDDARMNITEEEKAQHPNVLDRYAQMNHKYASFLDYLGYLAGTIEFEIPDGPIL